MSKNENKITIPNLNQFAGLHNYSGPISTIILNRIKWNFHRLIKVSSVQGLIRGIPFLKNFNSLIRAKSLRKISSRVEVSQINLYNPIAIKPTINLLKK